jgi:peptide deformylase
MTETMMAANGAGLAAIQVGAPLRLFIVDGEVAGGAEASPPRVFVNPEIVEISKESQTGDEGCLSFPGIYVPVKRGLRARVRAQDEGGHAFELEGSELLARALQHETDHLNGRLLIDQVGPVKREIIKRKLRKDLEAERQDEETAERPSARAAR